MHKVNVLPNIKLNMIYYIIIKILNDCEIAEEGIKISKGKICISISV